MQLSDFQAVSRETWKMSEIIETTFQIKPSLLSDLCLWVLAGLGKKLATLSVLLFFLIVHFFDSFPVRMVRPRTGQNFVYANIWLSES